MRKYRLFKEAVLKITFYEEIKKSLKRLTQIKDNLIKPTKEV
jgi:hypothetical protein